MNSFCSEAAVIATPRGISVSQSGPYGPQLMRLLHWRLRSLKMLNSCIARILNRANGLDSIGARYISNLRGATSHSLKRLLSLVCFSSAFILQTQWHRWDELPGILRARRGCVAYGASYNAVGDPSINIDFNLHQSIWLACMYAYSWKLLSAVLLFVLFYAYISNC